MEKKTITPEEAVTHLEEFRKAVEAHIWKVYDVGEVQLAQKIKKLRDFYQVQ